MHCIADYIKYVKSDYLADKTGFPTLWDQLENHPRFKALALVEITLIALPAIIFTPFLFITAAATTVFGNTLFRYNIWLMEQDRRFTLKRDVVGVLGLFIKIAGMTAILYSSCEKLHEWKATYIKG